MFDASGWEQTAILVDDGMGHARSSKPAFNLTIQLSFLPSVGDEVVQFFLLISHYHS